MQTNATLSLAFEARRNETIMRVHKQEPPLRVIRAFPLARSAQSNRQIYQHIGRNGHSAGQNGSRLNGHSFESSSLNSASLNSNLVDMSMGQAAEPVLVHLHNVSGGLLGGDQLHMDLTVGAQAQAQVTSTSSTRIYRSREGHPTTTQTMKIMVDEGGLLEYLPDTLIPYAHSKYRQVTQIDLADGAGLFYWEVITPGREAKGECFDYESLGIELELRAKDAPISIERNYLEPDRLRMSTLRASGNPFESLVRLGSYRYFATFYICRVGMEPQTWLELEQILDQEARVLSESGQTMWGISPLTAHGVSIRAVSKSSHAVQKGLPHFWRVAKEMLYHQEAVMPRKIY